MIATASQRNHDYLRSLGAAEVIDYNKVKFEEHVKDVDFVWDTVGGETLTRSLKVVRRGGVLVSVAGKADPAACVAAGIRCLSPSMPGNDGFSSILREIAQLADSGQLRLNIERVFPLEEAGAAQELNKAGHTRGKIILHIADK